MLCHHITNINLITDIITSSPRDTSLVNVCMDVSYLMEVKKIINAWIKEGLRNASHVLHLVVMGIFGD